MSAELATADRQAILAREVSKRVQGGYRVESQTATQAVLVKGRRPNHVLHLILSLVTLGVWIPVWFFVACFAGEKRQAITIGPDGSVEKARGYS